MLDIQKDIKDTTVVVAMSGGVDSSTVAAMAALKGYKVIGVTLQLYDHGALVNKKGACCAGQDIYDASEVARKIGIPHYVLDYESRFKSSVIDNFVESYVNGETPLPCVQCNQSVKFKDLFSVAKDLKADALLTGHYVQRINSNGIIQMHKGIDHKKDQSYFLFATTYTQLEFLHFPLGGMTKDQTRQLANNYGLSTANKNDSQDICFVGDGSYKDIIKKYRPSAFTSGDIIHIDGYKIGSHMGIVNYTIGQRRGLGISSHEPLYVNKIDPEKNIVYVGPESALKKTRFYIKDINWIANDEVFEDVEVKIRSTTPPIPAKISFDKNNTISVDLLQSEKSVTPGQACVIYNGTRVLGGGWITREIL